MTSSAVRRWRRLGVLVVVALLAWFHLELLVQRLIDGSVGHPVVVAQWVLSLGVLWLLSRLHRRGISIVSGPRAMVLWLLVLLVHAVAVDPGGGRARLTVDQELLVAAPLGAALGSFVHALLKRLEAATRKVRGDLGCGRHAVWRHQLRSSLSPHHLLPAPRAPPA